MQRSKNLWFSPILPFTRCFMAMFFSLYCLISRYIKLVRKHGLEISQPGLEPNRGLTWQMTKRRGDREVHK